MDFISEQQEPFAVMWCFLFERNNPGDSVDNMHKKRKKMRGQFGGIAMVQQRNMKTKLKQLL